MVNFVIVGAQKSASTWLAHALESHPAIGMLQGEHPYFEEPSHSQIARSDFEKLFTAFTNKAAVGLKRPTYLYKPESPQLIAEYNPNMKIIAVVRDPIQRAISAYYWYLYTSMGPVATLNEGLRKVISGDYSHNYPRMAEILEGGYYYKQLQRYSALFKESNILVLTLKTIQEDPELVLKNVIDFLGVNSTYHIPNSDIKINVNTVYSLPRIMFQQRFVNPLRYRYDSPPLGLIQRPAFSPLFLASECTQAFNHRVLSMVCPGKKDVLDDDNFQYLYELYHDDSMKLMETYQLDIKHWQTIQ